MKEDVYNVRVKFEHGNPLSIDLKGCGNLYLLPMKEYFFEGAPMQFINYIKQLRRLGITYKITDDKKGCYMTIGMSHYLDTIAQRVMGEVRANLSVNPPEIVKEPRVEKKSDAEKELEREIPDLIPKEAFTPKDVQEIKLDMSKIVKDPEPTPESPKESLPEDTKVEEPKEVDLETLTSKQDLIDYAHSLGLTEVSNIWTKKEIRKAITDKLDEK